MPVAVTQGINTMSDTSGILRRQIRNTLVHVKKNNIVEIQTILIKNLSSVSPKRESSKFLDKHDARKTKKKKVRKAMVVDLFVFIGVPLFAVQVQNCDLSFSTYFLSNLDHSIQVLILLCLAVYFTFNISSKISCQCAARTSRNTMTQGYFFAR